MKKIAVIEDNPDNRLLLRAILEERYEITDYESGFEALTGLPAQPPDLVLLDISLPGMDGTEVLKKIRAEPALSKLPVIALTAHAMSGDREKYLSLGFGVIARNICLSASTTMLPNRSLMKPSCLTRSHAA